MADDAEDLDDQIWRPGYSGPAPSAQPIRLSHATGPAESDDDDPPPSPSSSRRTVAIVAIAAIAAIAAVAVVSAVFVAPMGPEDHSTTATVDEVAPAAPRYELPDFVTANGAPFAGADPKRLPRTLDPFWTQQIQAESHDDVWVEVVDRRLTLVSIGGDRTSTTGATESASVLQALDAETGVVRWTTDVAAPPRSMSLVAANANSIALVAAGQLVGIDISTGDEVWRLARPQPVFDGDAEQLPGTGLVAVSSPDGTSTLLDITSGATAGRLGGPTIATDGLGRSYVRRGTEIVEYDLGEGFREPTLIAADIDDSVVAIVDRAILGSGPAGWRTWDAGQPEPTMPDGADDFPVAAAIVPMLGSTFVVAGAGSVIGADLDDGAMRSGWKRNGALTAVHPTDRGYLIQTASSGGAAQTIYDGRTGDAVLALTMVPGWSESLTITGNGIVTRKTSRDGSRLAGLDLDGEEIWSISGVDAASVGDRIVVTTIRLDDGSVQLDALGELNEAVRPGA